MIKVWVPWHNVAETKSEIVDAKVSDTSQMQIKTVRIYSELKQPVLDFLRDVEHEYNLDSKWFIGEQRKAWFGFNNESKAVEFKLIFG